MPDLPPLPLDFPADRRVLAGRAAAGEWLSTGEVGKLLNVHRVTVHRMIRAQLIGYREVPGAAVKQPRRECNPVDVIRALSEHLYEHRGPNG